MQYLLGIDIGTTGTKAALFDSEGTLLAASYRELRLYYPRPGWVEQNPVDFSIPQPVIPSMKWSINRELTPRMWRR